MAAPVDSYVQLPDDSGNSGKKIRSQTQTVSGNTVHTHYFYSQRQANVLGVYRAALAQQTMLVSAQNGTSTGFLWLHNPTATSNKSARIRRIYASSQHASAIATPSAPRLLVSRFTFVGTASGAAVTAAKVVSSAPSPILDLRTAVTGLTVSLVAAMGSCGVVGALTAVGAWAPAVVELLPSGPEDEWEVLAPGEGAVIWQDTAGTTSDTRVANICAIWDEIDVG